MSEKRFLPGSITISAEQSQMNGSPEIVHNGKPLIASVVPFSAFELMELFIRSEQGEVIPTPATFTESKLASVFAGLDIHATLMIFGIALRRHSHFHDGKQISAAHLSPYQPKERQALFDYLFQYGRSGELFEEDSKQNLPLFFLNAYDSFERWKKAYTFDKKLTHRNTGLYGRRVLDPNTRSRMWHWKSERGQKIAKRVLNVWYALQKQLETGSISDPAPKTSKAIYETPMQLYTILDDETAAMMSWVQPDQIVRLENGRVLCIDSKSPGEKEKISTYNDYHWLQILLSATASFFLDQRFLHGDSIRVTPTPPIQKFPFSPISNIVDEVEVYLQFPEIYHKETGQFGHIRLQVDEDQKIRSLQLYEYLIRLLADPYTRQRYYNFVESYDPENSGITPKLRVQSIETIQARLLIANLTGFLPIDLSRLTEQELEEL